MKRLLAGLLLLIAGMAAAETIIACPRLSPPVLLAGTPVRMETAEPLSSKTAREGQRFEMTVIEEVRVGGLLVIPKGARGVGEVSRVKEKGVFGKSGKLRIRAMFVELGGTRIRVDGEAGEKGKPGTAPVVIGAPLIGLSAAFFSGTSAVIPAGTRLDGHVWKDLPLVPAE